MQGGVACAGGVGVALQTERHPVVVWYRRMILGARDQSRGQARVRVLWWLRLGSGLWS